MIARVESFVLQGIDAVPCEIEVDVEAASLRKTTIVGLPDAAVRESMQRVRSALANAGYRYPRGHVTINLAPAHLRKEGPVYDLPIAVALLCADGAIEKAPRTYLMAGELALDGRLRSVRGVISLAILARRLGRRGVIVPRENVAEASAVGDVDAIGVEAIAEVVAFANGELDLVPHVPDAPGAGAGRGDREDAAEAPGLDFADVRGQETAKRALTVAAAGSHNVILIGPAGTGKTMMAKALAGVLPPLTREEMIEVTSIYSSAGALPPGEMLVTCRPVRAPHHTASAAAIIGGGSVPRPGDVSLAHRGVLFLDEMPEFSRAALETLRQPLEDGWVTIARARGSVRYPARFMLVGALNPTRDGGRCGPGDGAAGPRSRRAMERYVGRLSGPLVDRVDLHVEVPAVPYRQLTSGPRGTDSATIRARVEVARGVQRDRQGARPNAELRGLDLDRAVALDEPGLALLGQAMKELHLSARAYDRIRRVARTIADLEGSVRVEPHHLAEAVQYRLLDRESVR